MIAVPNLDIDAWDILATMWGTQNLFKSLVNFTPREFEKLAQLMVPTITSHVRSTWESHCTSRQPSKLASEWYLFSFILFMKHDVIKYDVFTWNWSKSAINDDNIFIASCINYVIIDNIQWPIVEQWQVLVTQLPQF